MCFSVVRRPTNRMRLRVARREVRACSCDRSMPQLIGMTPVMSIVDSRKSAALRVGVVTARVMSNVRLASAHASLSDDLVQGVRAGS